MKDQDLLNEMIKTIDDKKAQNPVVLNIQGLSVIADYFIICHGNSETQVQAIADAVKEKAEEFQLINKPMEGYDEARWVLVDLGDMIIHIFHREEREYYHLEKLWSDAQRVEVGEA